MTMKGKRFESIQETEAATTQLKMQETGLPELPQKVARMMG
jgi:hypothetical protein